MEQPAWLEQAWRELGVSESAGTADNPAIRKFFRDAGRGDIQDDEVAWCAAFVGACLERVGITATHSLAARSYLVWGRKLDEPCLGAVAVLSRGADPALGHVGFVVGETEQRVLLLGGNQADSVRVTAFEKSQVLGYRWPSSEPGAQVGTYRASFETALAHVLEMEGGYGEDPYDPGGPTNQGITLAVLAAWKGPRCDQPRRAEAGAQADYARNGPPDLLRSLLGSVPPLSPSCTSTPPSIMASALLCACCRKRLAPTSMARWEPRTRAAIGAKPVVETIRAYAEIRRVRYRALPHYWRFGRGWISRTAKTEARALALLDPSSTRPMKGQPHMQNDTTALPGGKWWGQSLTV